VTLNCCVDFVAATDMIFVRKQAMVLELIVARLFYLQFVFFINKKKNIRKKNAMSFPF